MIGGGVQSGARAAQIRCGGSNEAMGSGDIDKLLGRIEASLSTVKLRQCSDGSRTGKNKEFGEHF